VMVSVSLYWFWLFSLMYVIVSPSFGANFTILCSSCGVSSSISLRFGAIPLSMSILGFSLNLYSIIICLLISVVFGSGVPLCINGICIMLPEIVAGSLIVL
jgi:hypothetical protein